MAMVFFKMYSEILEDRKVQELSGDLFKFWVNILALANRQKDRGTIPAPCEAAFYLRSSVGEVEANLEALKAAGLIDETPDGLAPHNWKERQKKVDRTSPERSKRYRQRHASVTPTVTPASRRDVTPEPSVTSRLRHADRHGTVTQKSRTDKEEDKYNTPQPPTGGEVCVSTNGSEPEPISEASPSESARPPFDDAELDRVSRKANDLFPALELGSKIRGLACSFRLDCIDAALTEMLSGDVQNWKYLIGITKRIEADGGPKKPQASPRLHNPEPPPPGGSYYRSAKTLARLAALAAAQTERESVAS